MEKKIAAIKRIIARIEPQEFIIGFMLGFLSCTLLVVI